MYPVSVVTTLHMPMHMHNHVDQEIRGASRRLANAHKGLSASTLSLTQTGRLR